MTTKIKLDQTILDAHLAISKAARAAEKASKLVPVFLQREANAKDTCSFGSLWLDYITGGGVPRGRIVGIAGPEHSGKSLIATDIAREQLQAGRTVVYLDAEGGNDPIFLKSRGIDFEQFRGARNKNDELKPSEYDSVYYYQPQSGEEFRNYIMTLLQAMPENRVSGPPPIVFILDSVKALIPEAMLENFDENAMAAHARMYSEILPAVQGLLTRSGCSFVYTNQLRLKPGVKFGSPEYEPCGETLKFFSAIRLRLNPQKPKSFLEKDHPMCESWFNTMEPKAGGIWQEPHYNLKGVEDGLDRYIHTAIRTVKNKVWNPQKVSWMRINFEKGTSTGHGLDLCFDAFSFMYELGIVTADSTKDKTFKLVKPSPFGADLSKIGIPDSFTYLQFKQFADLNPQLRKQLRDELMVTGKCFAPEPEAPEVQEAVQVGK